MSHAATGDAAGLREVSAPVRDILEAWASQERRGVIFDFNGTLSDDEAILQEIFSEIFYEELGFTLTPQEYADRLVGHSDREIIEIVVAEQVGNDADLVETLLGRRRERYLLKVAETSPVLPESVELVERLAQAGVPMAVVTGAQRADVLHVLERSPAGSFLETLVTEEDVSQGKPHPEGFLTGARLLGLKPSEVLVFEDSVPGMNAAAAAGMWCIGVSGAPVAPGLRDLTSAVVPALVPQLLDRLPGFS